MNTDCTEQATALIETDIDGERLELAAAIDELYTLGLIAKEIDGQGTPRFRPTGRPI